MQYLQATVDAPSYAEDIERAPYVEQSKTRNIRWMLSYFSCCLPSMASFAIVGTAVVIFHRKSVVGSEEARALLVTAEQELSDTKETLADLTNVNRTIDVAKKKLESELDQLNADLDEMTIEARLFEDKAVRLADELRCEQKLALNLKKDKKLLEAQCKDAATRADEAEVNALKGGRKAMIKMETRIRELESELDAESRRFGDVTKNLRKSERSIKELTFAADEDRKNHERMQALIDQLQGKVKSYKKQIEEAEEIAALNLAKYRKVAGALGDAEASADANEQVIMFETHKEKNLCSFAGNGDEEGPRQVRLPRSLRNRANQSQD